MRFRCDRRFQLAGLLQSTLFDSMRARFRNIKLTDLGVFFQRVAGYSSRRPVSVGTSSAQDVIGVQVLVWITAVYLQHLHMRHVRNRAIEKRPLLTDAMINKVGADIVCRGGSAHDYNFIADVVLCGFMFR